MDFNDKKESEVTSVDDTVSGSVKPVPKNSYDAPVERSTLLLNLSGTYKGVRARHPTTEPKPAFYMIPQYRTA